MVDNEVVMRSECLILLYTPTFAFVQSTSELRPNDSYVRNPQRPESEGVISYTTANNIIHYNVTLCEACPVEDDSNELGVSSGLHQGCLGGVARDRKGGGEEGLCVQAEISEQNVRSGKVSGRAE